MGSVLRLVGFVTLISLGVLPAQKSDAANKLLDWTFNDATFVDANGGDTGAREAARAVYTPPGGISEANPSPGSGGKNILGSIDSLSNPQRSQPTLGKAGQWGLTQFYVSLYMYIHPDIPNGELESIKLFEVSDSSDSIDGQTLNWLIVQLYPDNFNLYCNCPAGGKYFGKWSGFLQGGWHKYEVFVKYNTPGQSDGIVKVWIDNVLVGQVTNVNYWSSTVKVNTFSAVYHFKTFGSAVGAIQGTVQIDDIQLWDDIPPNAAPSPPSNVRLR